MKKTIRLSLGSLAVAGLLCGTVTGDELAQAVGGVMRPTALAATPSTIRPGIVSSYILWSPPNSVLGSTGIGSTGIL